jgi:LPXTG-motif cell wall-anchored protein
MVNTSTAAVGARRRGPTTLISRALLALGLVLAVLGVMAPAQATQNPPELPPTATNPGLEPGCGIDIGVVIDRSGSIADAGKAQVYKDAVSGLVDAFAGTPSTIGFWSFGNAASDTDAGSYPWQQMTAVGGADYQTRVDDLKAAVQAIPIVSGVATNWEAGIAAPLQASVAAVPKPDLVIVVTDGDPTTFNGDGSNSGGSTDANDLAKGIESANAIKGWGARVFAAGVGGATESRLKLISGETKFDGTNVAAADYLIEPSFDSFQSALRELATDICGGSVTVTKLASTPDAPDVYAAAAGWSFAASLDGEEPPTLTSTPDPAVTGADGTVNFSWSSVGDETITITETQQEGFTLQDVECANGQEPIEVAQVTDGVELTVGSKDIVSCTFKNKAAPPPPSCPEGTTWVDDNENGKVDEGECETPPPPRCPQGTTWVDANHNEAVDEGECHTPPPPPPPVDECPAIPGNQPAGTDCTPPPPVDQCPDDPGLQPNADQCTIPEVEPEVVTSPVVVPTAPAPQVQGEVITAPAQLPRTGADPLPLAQVGLGLVLLGAGGVLSGRRRPT